jgi:prepilin-type N-terminal cleavage/methylation domain-containing protein
MKRACGGSRREAGRGRGAFTIIEIMIVVGIIALLASIAIPYFVRYRANAQAKVCVANMRQLEAAKEQWALENRKTTGATVDFTDLIGGNAYIKNSVGCPASTTAYNLGAVGDRPTCPTSLPEHVLP